MIYFHSKNIGQKIALLPNKSKERAFFLFQAMIGYISFNHSTCCSRNHSTGPNSQKHRTSVMPSLLICDICEQFSNKVVATCCQNVLCLWEKNFPWISQDINHRATGDSTVSRSEMWVSLTQAASCR